MRQVIPVLLSLAFSATVLNEESAKAKLASRIDLKVAGTGAEAFSGLARAAEIMILADPAISGTSRIVARSKPAHQVLEELCRQLRCSWQLAGGVIHVFSGETPPTIWREAVLYLPCRIEIGANFSAQKTTGVGARDAQGRIH